MVADGNSVKLIPLAELPMEEPPVSTVYHFIIFPEAVAFKSTDDPHETDAGVTVTLVGLLIGVTVITTESLEILTHCDPYTASA